MKKRILIILLTLILVSTLVSAGTFNDVLSSLFGTSQQTQQNQTSSLTQSSEIQQAPQALTWVEYVPTGTYPIEPGFGIWTSKTIYDPVQRATILYASDSGATYSNSFWAYDSTTHTWQKKTTTGSTGSGACPSPPNHPGDRHPYEQMDYDPIRGRMYLYGGVCSGTGLSDTWYYQSSGNSWTQVIPSVNPGNMVEGALAFDSSSDLIVLYGGFNPSTANTITQVWHYSPATNTWQNIAATIGDIYKNNMVYDSINRKVVLFGGSQSYSGAAVNDIWLYDTPTRTWTNPNPSTKPTGLKFPPIAFDTKRGYVFYYAGQGNLWTYSVATNTWTNLNVPGGPPLSGDQGDGYTLSYDAYTDKLIATSRFGCCSREAWELDLISLPSPISSCGNGLVEGSEVCDDANTNNTDGCSSTCALESGWSCAGQPSRCMFGVPYPPSQVITNISWDFANILRAAQGSDLWPTTWSDDDNLYTDWGDGGGFGGDDTLGRVSFGVGKVQGTGSSWQGFNVWGGLNPISNQTPTTGKGNGGIISINSVLYVFVEEEGVWTRSKLWTSADHGLNWIDRGWVLEWPNAAFGVPGLIQFGKDYNGSRDNYVYGYSERGMGFTPPGLGLFRVPKDQLANKASYEFFSGLDVNSNPTWSINVNQRQPVFSDPSGVNWGVNAMYNPVLGRYIMAVAHTSTGDWGIFEAPQPWGPWSTVAYYSDWIDSTFKFTFVFPQKWMSPDSKTMYMIFSGTGIYDSFNVIKATLGTSSVTDTTPPNRINLNPQGTSFSTNTTQVSISLNTDEIATCRFSASPNIPYSSMILSFSQVNSTIHSTTILSLSPGDNKTFYVKCIDQLGNANTNDVQIYFNILLPDTTPPTITQVTSSGDPTKVNIVFSESVDQTSATTISNYVINNGIIISGASLAADLKTLTLTTSSHTQGPTYTLTVSNIRDRAPTPNIIVPNTQASYTFTPQLIISNLVVASGKAYQIVNNGLVTGALLYIDRTYTYTIIPPSIQGSTYIMTANDDKALVNPSFLSFDSNQGVSIYVAHDNRNPLPTWLSSSFTSVGNNLFSTDATLGLFVKNFSAGTITLGGNEDTGGNSMYTVIIVPLSGAAPVNDTTPPSQPTGLSATPVSSSQINLAWTASTDNVGVVGYKIYRNNLQITTSSTNSYQDTGLTQNTTYTYKVSAYDGAGLNSQNSTSVSATTFSQAAGGNTTCGSSVTSAALTITESVTPRPNLLSQYTDPKLGACVTRVTDNVLLNVYNPVIEYSQLQAWNSDQSKILLTSGHILYANNYSVYSITPSISAPRWSHTDPNIIYSTSGNSFEKYNIATNTFTCEPTMF